LRFTQPTFWWGGLAGALVTGVVAPIITARSVRHTAAVLWLTNGVHFMQVSKWLGHSSYVLTLTAYADYIPDVEAENPLTEPVAAVSNTNVVPLRPAAEGGKLAGP
jgi:integrase